MSSTAVGYNCSVKNCKQTGYVRVAEMIKAGKELVPTGWGHYDLGVDGPEEYNLCPKHKEALQQMENSNFRQFINGDIHWEAA